MANTYSKAELEELYETHTLEEIGQRYGVSRERIRQVMDKFGIKRRSTSGIPAVCDYCGGKGYREFEHGLIQMPCGKCSAGT